MAGMPPRGTGCYRQLFMVAALCISGQLCAQNIDEFTLSGDDAIEARSETEINVATAERIAKECVRWASEQGRRVSVVILGLGGNLVYAYRMDGHRPINIDSAQWKAETALYYRRSSHAIRNQYGRGNNLAQMIHMKQYFVEGGLPIIVDEQMIGAIGVGGWRDNDERCAHHALEEIIGPQPPLVED
jgi:glc operon protein GlcG